MGNALPEGFAINAPKLIIQSDEELAIVSAISTVFPGAIQLLCSRHISENLKRHIAEMDLSARDKSDLHGRIMDLRHSTDLGDFKQRGHVIVEEVTREQEPHHAEYIEQVIDKLLKYNVEPRLQEGPIVPPDFDTNPSESYNHYIKMINDWRPMKIPALIKRLDGMVNLQDLEFRGAVHSSGNYRLTRQFKHLGINDETWASWNGPEGEAKKVEAVEKVRNAKARAERPRFVGSRDTLLQMPNVQRISRKPHQDRSAWAERVSRSRGAGSRSRSRGARRGSSV